ncbi:gamma-type small acid-soluble spore protein [Radiobacillus deserti]|uniref:Small, acid-soluble spore protein gamma-type n=1 Tax=Radiobacillus deserti TaxID=2594883 RepID=A0A516KD94_9BACI|nr:gamma-type small acid-soluble spore protein [Radiobacillus deserti]QDP39382.1 gamma-type small acid-soluble spore protein [Radiobacillus deserti]
MAKKNKTVTGTDVQEVQRQNQAASQGQQFGTEFASETDAQSVRQKNKKSQQKK